LVIYAVAFQCSKAHRVDIAGRETACAEGKDFVFAIVAEQPFGHDAAAAVASAKNEKAGNH